MNSSILTALEIVEMDHLGIAVSDLHAASAQYQLLLGFAELFREELPDHGVRVCFLELGTARIELRAPLS